MFGAATTMTGDAPVEYLPAQERAAGRWTNIDIELESRLRHRADAPTEQGRGVTRCSGRSAWSGTC